MSDPDSPLKRTPLHGLHLELGGKMVPFAGYEMPVQYPGGILKEHSHTREAAGLFDVSHMGQIRLSGDEAAAALETLVPVDVAGLAPGRQRYALFTNEAGGILDDLMVTNAGDHLFVVVNAACKEQDLAHLERHIGGGCRVEALAERALLALQGPAAVAVMARLAPKATELVFMSGAAMEIALESGGAACFVTRSGYTGEDGFEIPAPAERAEALARALLEQPEVAPIGLGARDSLRLEAGLCLYGHDIDDSTTPVEAGLAWALSKARRKEGARPGGYPGAEVIQRQLEEGVARRRVGIRPEGRAPIREDCQLTDQEGGFVGRVTSGGFGPTVGGPVAMGYVRSDLAKPGTTLQAMLRGKPQPVVLAKLPFVELRYHRG
ncbi:MAG: glycine cleavage system aminomethyltransferase GcvT [Kiloniellales bacterium]